MNVVHTLTASDYQCGRSWAQLDAAAMPELPSLWHISNASAEAAAIAQGMAGGGCQPPPARLLLWLAAPVQHWRHWDRLGGYKRGLEPRGGPGLHPPTPPLTPSPGCAPQSGDSHCSQHSYLSRLITLININDSGNQSTLWFLARALTNAPFILQLPTADTSGGG